MEEIQEQVAEEEDRGQSASKSKRIAKVIEHSPPERRINTLTAMLSDRWGTGKRRTTFPSDGFLHLFGIRAASSAAEHAQYLCACLGSPGEWAR